ncbi:MULTISPECIES: helix-turn-helix domain-containing protein [Chitinophaga]|uniref:winged helix-turn-helix transcriptional regulator n=1 Tax=Chitinophaga TaxID=79328 RepID=UPI0009D13357|nr:MULTISPECIES: helix-turn-helix domain-containing protein [Chitinophaga]OMP76378.1 hypothetical protein BW716_25490 [[Flexibacter] sp. ATCC 35208]WPQ63491.1 helix-turn-helix domain-containing protein [Chitinophaga sancti]WPV67925.1 helix-turn-helix domain-containing protein [Chitinophaga sp. LS1]
MATKVKTSSMNAHNLQVLAEHCQVSEVLELISPRWKMQVLFCISQEVYQFSQLKKVFPTISDQVLSKRLGEIVTEGLAVKLNVPDTMPCQVKYEVTEKGAALLEIVQDLHEWGKREWE